jgi:hypothetical protein
MDGGAVGVGAAKQSFTWTAAQTERGPGAEMRCATGCRYSSAAVLTGRPGARTICPNLSRRTVPALWSGTGTSGTTEPVGGTDPGDGPARELPPRRGRRRGEGPPRSSRANSYAERWVRAVRAECLEWTLIWNQRQLHRVLTEYLPHYNTVRPHRSLDLQPPRPAPRLMLVEPDPVASPVQRVDVLGGLIHEYRRAA